MAFINTIAPRDASGEVRDMYVRQQGRWGYVPNYARVFCHRPEIMALWANLLAGIRRHIEPRRFELVTMAAARELRNSACALAHGQALTAFFAEAEVCAIAAGDLQALTAADAAMVKFARQVAADASAVTHADIDTLRRLGFSDAEIFDIVATAAARAFFTKVLDGLGVLADMSAASMPEALRKALVVGRPISGEANAIVAEEL